MASPTWNTYGVTPLGFGGAAKFSTWAIPPEGETVLGTAVLVAAAGVATVTDPSAARTDLGPEKNALAVNMALLADAAVASFFVNLSTSGWVKGPEVEVDLGPDWDSLFPDLKPWIIASLKKAVAQKLPSLSGGGLKTVEVRGAYPRDSFPRPCISVMLEAVPPSQRTIGDVAATRPGTYPRFQVEERWPFNLSFTILLWCNSPEDRDDLTPWFASSMQLLAAMAPYMGLTEPSFDLSEGEDFTLSLTENPLFYTSSKLTGIAWSQLRLPGRNLRGQISS